EGRRREDDAPAIPRRAEDDRLLGFDQVRRARGVLAVRRAGRGKAQPLWLVALLDEADRAARLEHAPRDLVERADPLHASRLGEVVERQALAPEVALDRLPVLNDDDRLAV